MCKTHTLVDPTYGHIIGIQISDDFEGGRITVHTSPVEITFAGEVCSVFIQSDHDNTGAIYIGKSSVASNGSNAMARLNAGEAISFDYDNESNSFYIVATISGQIVYKMGLT